MEEASLDKRAVRKCYLITYSQVDKSKSENKETFCNKVTDVFDSKNESSVKPVYSGPPVKNNMRMAVHTIILNINMQKQRVTNE